MSQSAKAEQFRKLHEGPEVLVLPNAWDAASAAIMADAGAKAVATSSAAVAWAYGYADGDLLPVDLVVATIAAVAKAAGDTPVTADIEGGFTDDLDQLSANVSRVIAAGSGKRSGSHTMPLQLPSQAPSFSPPQYCQSCTM